MRCVMRRVSPSSSGGLQSTSIVVGFILRIKVEKQKQKKTREGHTIKDSTRQKTIEFILM
jgi:hypothetical protein